MTKTFLFRRTNTAPELVGKYNNTEDAQTAVKDLVDEYEDGTTIFDYFVEEREYVEITERVKSYADACQVLGIEPMNEGNMKAQGFRPDEIARRKLETITAALNEGWVPNWADTTQDKWVPWFYVEPKDGARAGLSFACTLYAPSYTYADIGSRLCFNDPETARYAGNTFIDLYEQIFIEKL